MGERVFGAEQDFGGFAHFPCAVPLTAAEADPCVQQDLLARTSYSSSL